MNETQTPELLRMKQKSPTQNRQSNLLQLRTTASGMEDLIPATFYSNTTLCSVSWKPWLDKATGPHHTQKQRYYPARTKSHSFITGDQTLDIRLTLDFLGNKNKQI